MIGDENEDYKQTPEIAQLSSETLKTIEQRILYAGGKLFTEKDIQSCESSQITGDPQRAIVHSEIERAWAEA
ncbi:MAG: hypothetical protein AABX30_02675 [Nanoarchaeota archaeon]